MMIDKGIDKIEHNNRESRHARILNTWIKDWQSDIQEYKVT